MNGYLRHGVDTFYGDFLVKSEVHNVIQDVICDIEVWDTENKLLRASRTLGLSETLNQKLVAKIRRLESKNKLVTSELQQIKIKAGEVRDLFVSDIHHFLAESKQTKKLQDRIAELGDINALLSEKQSRNNNEDEKAPPVESAHNPSTMASEQSTPLATEASSPITTENSASESHTADTLAETSSVTSSALVIPSEVSQKSPWFYDVPKDFFIESLAFLEEHDIYTVGETSKYMFYYIDKLFEMNSTLVENDWSNKMPVPWKAPEPTPAAVPVAPTTTTAATRVPSATSAVAPEHRLTKELMLDLTKKLKPNELKVILVMAETLKKQTDAVESLTTAKEDLTARLENTESVRDFLIDKLKTAEQAIKSTMNDNSTLKKQAVADREIISFLDLQVQDLEGEKVEANNRCNHLQASLDLQLGSHSLKEQQLSKELEMYKLNYEQLDAKFKSEKKILVKEVKNLRYQVDSLTHERNLHANQFQLLRDAFNTTSIGPSSGMSGGSVGGGAGGGRR